MRKIFLFFFFFLIFLDSTFAVTTYSNRTNEYDLLQNTPFTITYSQLDTGGCSGTAINKSYDNSTGTRTCFLGRGIDCSQGRANISIHFTTSKYISEIAYYHPNELSGNWVSNLSLYIDDIYISNTYDAENLSKWIYIPVDRIGSKVFLYLNANWQGCTNTIQFDEIEILTDLQYNNSLPSCNANLSNIILCTNSINDYRIPIYCSDIDGDTILYSLNKAEQQNYYYSYDYDFTYTDFDEHLYTNLPIADNILEETGNNYFKKDGTKYLLKHNTETDNKSLFFEFNPIYQNATMAYYLYFYYNQQVNLLAYDSLGNKLFNNSYVWYSNNSLVSYINNTFFFDTTHKMGDPLINSIEWNTNGIGLFIGSYNGSHYFTYNTTTNISNIHYFEWEFPYSGTPIINPLRLGIGYISLIGNSVILNPDFTSDFPTIDILTKGTKNYKLLVSDSVHSPAYYDTYDFSFNVKNLVLDSKSCYNYGTNGTINLDPFTDLSRNYFGQLDNGISRFKEMFFVFMLIFFFYFLFKTHNITFTFTVIGAYFTIVAVIFTTDLICIGSAFTLFAIGGGLYFANSR